MIVLLLLDPELLVQESPAVELGLGTRWQTAVVARLAKGPCGTPIGFRDTFRWSRNFVAVGETP